MEIVIVIIINCCNSYVNLYYLHYLYTTYSYILKINTH